MGGCGSVLDRRPDWNNRFHIGFSESNRVSHPNRRAYFSRAQSDSELRRYYQSHQRFNSNLRKMLVGEEDGKPSKARFPGNLKKSSPSRPSSVSPSHVHAVSPVTLRPFCTLVGEE